MTSSSQAPPHAPELGRMHRLLGSLHVTGVFWFRLHRWGVMVLPRWAIPIVITIFTTFFFFTLRRIGRAVASNLAVVLGPCGFWERQKRVYRTFWNFAWCLSERYERMSTDRHTSMTIDGEEHWETVHESDKGFVAVTAHIGHWEVGSMLVPERRVHVVREQEIDPRSQAFIQEMLAENTANTVMHFVRDDDPSLAPRLLGALRRGEVVALQGDRPRTTGRTVRVELFGRPLDLPLGPAALARAADVPLLPVYVFRCRRRQSKAVVRPPFKVDEPGLAGITAAMQQIAGEVEWAVRQNPFQWFCFRELWPDQSR